MPLQTPPRLLEKLIHLNRGRLGVGAIEDAFEEAFEREFAASKRLAVFDTQAPGGRDESMLADLGADWRRGWVPGYLVNGGSRGHHGYQGVAWDPSGDEVDAWLLTSDRLPQRLADMDESRGHNFARIVTPFETSDGETLIANMYALRDATSARYAVNENNIHDDERPGGMF